MQFIIILQCSCFVFHIVRERRRALLQNVVGEPEAFLGYSLVLFVVIFAF